MKKETCLFLDKKELEILLTSVDFIKDFNKLAEYQAISNKLINKINQCLQSYIDEDLTSQKEFFNQYFFEPVYNELFSLFNRALEPITISIDGNIQYANLEFCKMLEYESENEILELGLFNLISKRCLPKIKNLQYKRSKGEIVPNIHNLELKRADGSLISIECVHYCMPFNKSYFIISFYIGLTKIQSLEKKLRESEKKYRELYEDAPNAYFSISPDKSIKRCNTTATKLLGYNHEEFLKMKVLDLYANDPDGLPKAKKIFQQFLKGKRIRDEELVMKHKNGDSIWISLSVKSIKNQVGVVIESHSVVIDINSRKKEELLHKFLSSAVAQCSEGVALSDLDGNLLFINDAFAKMHGYTSQELIGKQLSIFHTPKQMVSVEMANKDLKEKGFFLGEIWHRHQDGTVFPTQMHNSLLLDNKDNPIGIFATIRDITKQKQDEQQLMESEKKYRDAFYQANFYKDLFAHDINSILHNISTGIQLNELYLNKPDKLEKVKKNISIIKKQVKKATILVSNVSKLSKLTEYEPTLFNTDLLSVLNKCVNYIINTFGDKNVKIQVENSENNYNIQADEFLDDIFENILTNSIKYNENDNIEITIKVTRELKEGISQVKMQFIDNGIGIANERKQQIFQREYSEKTSDHGLGIGLSLVKKIVDSYNGDIWIEDVAKGDHAKGTNFVILIPEEV